MAADLRVGDIGASIRVTIRDQDNVVVSLATTTTRQLFLRKPSGAVLTKTAALVSGGTTGIMEYVSIAGDLDVPGDWQLQARIVTASIDLKSSIAAMPVRGNLT
jgi:hypothetical protein